MSDLSNKASQSKPNPVPEYADLCAACGHRFGLHSVLNDHCPKVDASPSHEHPWRDTRFAPVVEPVPGIVEALREERITMDDVTARPIEPVGPTVQRPTESRCPHGRRTALDMGGPGVGCAECVTGAERARIVAIIEDYFEGDQNRPTINDLLAAINGGPSDA